MLGGLFPNVCLKIVRSAQQGEAEQARRLDAGLAPIWHLFKTYSSLRVVYAMVEVLDICQATPPRPILPLPDAVKRKVAEALTALPTELKQ